MRGLLLALVPGSEDWLWRRVSLLASVGVLLYCLVVAVQKGDAATADHLIIGLIGVLGIYTGGAVTDDHLKRQSEKAS